MESVYKTCFYNSSGNISHIWVFCGDESQSADQYFSRSEYNLLTTKKVDIRCVGLAIHPDDSIYDIKRKILFVAFQQDQESALCFEELYLFGVSLKKFDLLSFYRNLTDSESHVLNLSLLSQSLVNYQTTEESISQEVLDLYHEHEINKTLLYEDLLKMPFFYSENSMKPQKIPLGHRFYNQPEGQTQQIQNVDESFIVNPFDLWKQATLHQKMKIQNFENDFLFHFGSLQDNLIYVATAEPVMDFCDSQQIDPASILPAYFPGLAKQNITNKSEWTLAKPEWVEQSRQKHYDLDLKTQYRKTSIFYDIFSQRTSELAYEERGIRDFFLILHPEDRVKKMPLENIFKHIHASLQIPFIQYNPGLRQENSYRIYYTETAQNGKKIPYLPKAVFTPFLNKMNRVQNICMFVDQHIVGEQRSRATLEVDDFVQLLLQNNGDIVIKGKLDQPLMPLEFNQMLTRLCEPALNMVNNFLQQSGYFINQFHSIYDSFVEVVDLNYVCKIQMKEMNLKKYMGCLSSLFYHEMQPAKQDGMRMRYKRVENFRNMSPEDNFIAGLLRHTQDKKFIATQVKKAFPYKDAKTVMQDYESRHMSFMIPGRYINKKIEMMENPGFMTSIKRSGKTYSIVMEGLNLSQYLEVIPIYLDSMLRMIIDPSVLNEEMKVLCKSKPIVSDEHRTLTLAPELAAEQGKIFEDTRKEKGIMVLGDDEGDDLVEPRKEKKGRDGDEDGDKDGDKDGEEDEDEEDSVPEDYDYGLDDYDEDDEDDDEGEDGDGAGEAGDDMEGGAKKAGLEPGSEPDSDSQPGSGSESETDSDSEDDDIQNTGTEKISQYWSKRIEKYDPVLFRVFRKGFTRMSQDEQPVVVSEEEMKQIDPAKYTNALKYRRDKHGRPLHYICPRYWCTKPSMEGPISEEEAKSGKCGKIMNTTNDRGKSAPIGEYVIEYSGMTPEPGFVKSNKHQLMDENNNPVCALKCFKKWDTKGQKDSRSLCAPEFYEAAPETEKGQGKMVRPTDNVIQESNTFPLSFGRAGKLPIPVQTFLSTNNELCIANKKIKPNCPVLLRYGPETTMQGKQSFLACLCDIYSFEKNKTRDPFSLEQFKAKIIESVTLDVFIELHNGSIAAVFQPHPNQELDDRLSELDIGPYKNTFFYSQLDSSDDSQLSFFKHSIVALLEFQKFLQDPQVTIDHTYMWEIMSRPNPLLFPDGLNLAILEMPEDDNTNNVILLCPTHVYTYPLFDPSRKTVLMLKQTNENGTYYETIYRYKRTYQVRQGKRVETEDIKKQFSNKSKDVKGLATVMQLIRNVTDGKCRPKKPQTYEFQHNKPFDEIKALLESSKSLEFKNRVMNFQGKTIGIMVLWKDKPSEVVSKGPFYLPCYPSTTSDRTLPILWMDNPDLWTDYYSTVMFLRHVYAISDQQIPCDPKFRVVSENQIAGILTMTNQFVQLDKPIENIAIGDGLKPLQGSNYILSDKKLQTKPIIQVKSPGRMTIQDQETHYIFLETQFYSVFRSTMRILLNIYRNRFKYKEIMELHGDIRMKFREKRRKVMDLLKEIGEKHIVFQEYAPSVLKSMHDIYNCQGNCRGKKYCLYREEDGQCVLLIPDKHLVSGRANPQIYYLRLADELLRHKRVHLFMFYPDSYLNISNTEMRVEADEFVITDYEFRNHYFKDLEAYPLKKYARATTYETAIPTTRTLPAKANWIEEFEKADRDLRGN